tara:strand:- start:17768 stop:18544 length:777 start_codon:yes stop_codon:yes gene_type:complete
MKTKLLKFITLAKTTSLTSSEDSRQVKFLEGGLIEDPENEFKSWADASSEGVHALVIKGDLNMAILRWDLGTSLEGHCTNGSAATLTLNRSEAGLFSESFSESRNAPALATLPTVPQQTSESGEKEPEIAILSSIKYINLEEKNTIVLKLGSSTLMQSIEYTFSDNPSIEVVLVSETYSEISGILSQLESYPEAEVFAVKVSSLNPAASFAIRRSFFESHQRRFKTKLKDVNFRKSLVEICNEKNIKTLTLHASSPTS